ncbi:hypothetical protein GQ457_06G033840 [Hibiscus cannabinus]
MEALPSLVMVAVECSNVVVSILFKAASFKGLSSYTFIAYSFVLSTFVFTFLLFLRKTVLFPPLKFPLISRLCLLAVTGYAGLVCSYKGIDLASPTLASAINNLTPAFTFILAVSFRMEKVELRRAASQAKIIGTITSISGALLMAFYKGPTVIPSSPSPSVLQLQRPLESSQSNWIIGGILLATAHLLYSCWYIIMAQIMKIYPEEIVVTCIYSLSVSLLAIPVSFITQPQLSSWRLTDTISVVAVLYTGLFGFSFSTCAHIWGIRLKGPVFVAIFRPTSIVIAAVMSATFLGEALYLGSVIGAVIITGGLYAVLWGKAKEAEEYGGLGPSSNADVPLLQSYK